MTSVLGRVEARLTESPYLAGPAYSLAEVAWTCIFARIKMLGLGDEFMDANEAPRICEYYERLRARPSFAQAGLVEGKLPASIRHAFLKGMLTGRSETRVEA